MRLLDVQYAEKPERNIFSYEKLEFKGCILEYRGGTHVLTSEIGGALVMNVDCCNNVLVVAVQDRSNDTVDTSREAMMTVFNSPE